MNDYVKGVVEALTWVLSLTERMAIRNKKNPSIASLQAEIEELREEALKAGAAGLLARLTV